MSQRPNRVKKACYFLAAAVLVPAALSAADFPDPAGHWEGAIVLPAGELQVKVDLERREGGGWQGTIDIPAQGARGLPLEGIQVEGEQVAFAIRGVPGNPTFDGRLSAAGIEGKFTQGAAALTFKLGREVVKPPARPQEPKPPFPYEEQEATYESGGVRLAGTLTLPAGEGPHPAVLLLTGSGAQDRDETLFGHKPFKVIADHLTRAGIAVLRMDDRGVGGSGGNVSEATLEDFADDALAGVRYLASHPAIDGRRVGLLGHSEGGAVAPLAASRSDDVAFVVILAGPAVPGDEIIARQLELSLLAGGASESGARKLAALQRELMATITSGANEMEVTAKLADVLKRQGELATGSAPADADIEQTVKAQLPGLLSPWYRYFLSYDPSVALAGVKVPVLALAGGLDLQVEPAQNLPVIARVLEKAGNSDVTVRELEGLNHLFQHAETGLLAEYGQIEETFAPEALEIVTKWILERTARTSSQSSRSATSGSQRVARRAGR